jgi:hypothetical protein
MQNHEQKK